ncbi:MAG: ArnT family glycosyltransferase [Flexilinea sp.]
MKINTFFRNDRIIILLASFSVRVLFLIFFLAAGFSETFSQNHYPDSATYIAPADSMIQKGQFLNENSAPEIYRTPGYPLFLAFCKLISGKAWIWTTIFFQNILSVIAILVLYALVLELCRNRTAALAGSLLVAFNLHDIYFSFFILSDSLFQSIILFAVYFLVRFFKRFHVADLLRAAGLFSAGTFIRPSGLYLPLVLTAAVFLVLLIKRAKKKALIYSLIFLLIGMGPAYLWLCRNERVAGFADFSAIRSSNLYSYHSAGVLAYKNGTDFYHEQANLKNSAELLELQKTMSLQAAEMTLAKKIIFQNIPVYLLLNIQGAGYILLYPGLFDIFQVNSGFLDYIAGVKSTFLNSSGFLDRLVTFLTQPYSILTLLDILILFGLSVVTILGIIRSFRIGIPWYISLILSGLFCYFLAVSAGPNGYGTFPRFRLSVSMLQALYFGIFTCSAQERQVPLERKA